MFSVVWSAAWPLAATAETYRWVDETGGVHYGDRPPAHTETTVIDHSAVEKAEQRARQQTPGIPLELQRQLDEIEVRRLERSVAERREREQREFEQKRQKFCHNLLADLQAIDTPRARIYRETEGGGNEYLTYKERQATRQRLIAAIDELKCR